MMWSSLKKLAALPPETALYCGHEYTNNNCRFALTVEPENEALRARAAEAAALAEEGEPALPTTIAQELATNPFLRPVEPRHPEAARHGGAGALRDLRRDPEAQGPVLSLVRRRADRRRSHRAARAQAASRGRAISARPSATKAGHKGRAHSTAILYLLKAGEVSRWHQVDAAELWHWYGGAPLLLEVKHGETRHEYRLGPIGTKATIRMRRCRRMPGRARGVLGPGRCSAAPSRPASTSPASRWRPRASSPNP